MSDSIPPTSPVIDLLPDWRPHFAEKDPRPLQGEVLDLLCANWHKYKNFILELPTGVGKSAIAMTLMRTLYAKGGQTTCNSVSGMPIYQQHHSYVTTTSIQLQHQYYDSFEHQGLHKLYAADHFKCNRGKDLTCGEGSRVCSAQETQCPGRCPYKVAKHDFIMAEFGILNLAYFINETYYAHQLPRRGLLICDEGHTVGDGVKNFVSLKVTDKALLQYRLIPPNPDSEGSYDIPMLVDWLESEYLSRVEAYQNQLASKIDQWLGTYEDKRFLDLAKEFADTDKHSCRVRRIIKELEPVGWVAERGDDEIIMTPLRPTPFMKEIVTNLNDKNLFMSATILDGKFLAQEYDLNQNDTLYFSAQSPFPKENRPIYFYPVGKLNHEKLVASMTPFAEAVKALLDAHPGERGIIFTSSYAQVKELMRQVGGNRLCTHEGSAGKVNMMERHKRVKDSVIVSPSMHEGVDLKGDLSRFQIVLKMPFASLGSKVIKARMEAEPEWYAYTTALVLIQSTGRSVRSDTDTATTYILDDTFARWSSTWRRFLPNYWLDALTSV